MSEKDSWRAKSINLFFFFFPSAVSSRLFIFFSFFFLPHFYSIIFFFRRPACRSAIFCTPPKTTTTTKTNKQNNNKQKQQQQNTNNGLPVDLECSEEELSGLALMNFNWPVCFGSFSVVVLVSDDKSDLEQFFLGVELSGGLSRALQCEAEVCAKGNREGFIVSTDIAVCCPWSLSCSECSNKSPNRNSRKDFGLSNKAGRLLVPQNVCSQLSTPVALTYNTPKNKNKFSFLHDTHTHTLRTL